MFKNEKQQRVVEAAVALLDAAPDRRMNAVTLNKSLFYLDLACLRDFGEPLTQNTFVALDFGPVVAKYRRRVFKPLEVNGLAAQLDEWDGSKPLQLQQTLSQLDFLDGQRRELAEQVGAFFGNLSSSKASDYSHENPGWEVAYTRGLRAGNPAQPIDLLIAMQQILEDDPWLHEPHNLDEAILAAADMADGVDW